MHPEHWHRRDVPTCVCTRVDAYISYRVCVYMCICVCMYTRDVYAHYFDTRSRLHPATCCNTLHKHAWKYAYTRMSVYAFNMMCTQFHPVTHCNTLYKHACTHIFTHICVCTFNMVFLHSLILRHQCSWGVPVCVFTGSIMCAQVVMCAHRCKRTYLETYT